jgi:hypothetical protein
MMGVESKVMIRKHAQELMTLAEKFRRNWNYGNAIQDGNLVFGRIAVKEGRLDEAKEFLRKAGKLPDFGANLIY